MSVVAKRLDESRCHLLQRQMGTPTERGTAAPHFSAHFALERSPISATAGLLVASCHTLSIVKSKTEFNLLPVSEIPLQFATNDVSEIVQYYLRNSAPYTPIFHP